MEHPTVIKLNKHQKFGLMRQFQINENELKYCINASTFKTCGESIKFIRLWKDIQHYEQRKDKKCNSTDS